MTPITDAHALSRALHAALSLPRSEQPEAIEALSRSIQTATVEEWNSQFGPQSLFDAWTGNHLIRGLYRANASTLRERLQPDWRVLEIGGGDGRLWADMGDLPEGSLWVVDPNPGVHQRLQESLPHNIRHHGIQGRIQDTLRELPEVDAVVCSLTLHHVAGSHTAERMQHGLEGPGKLEILQALSQSLQSSQGVLMLNEADVHCDLELDTGDPILLDRLIDSYVRRTARALTQEMAELERGGDPQDRAPRLLALIKHWCLDQVQMAFKPIAERDVYELDVPRWLKLFEQADLEVLERGFTDSSLLFHRYLLQPRRA